MYGQRRNKTYLRRGLILIIGLLSCNIYAATASRVGGSGMSWMRTGDTLTSGETVFYDQMGIDTYVILNSNLSDYDLFNNFGINYGLFDALELDFQTSYLANDQHKSAGIRSYKGILKFRLLGDKIEDSYAVTFSTFKTVSPADKGKMIGSGSSESGAEINTSYYGDDVNLHLTLGSATADAKYYDPDVVYYSVEKQYLNLGAEFKVSDVFTFGIEMIKERSDNVEFDENTLYALSLQYKVNRTWDFDFGASFGVPEDRSEPVKSFYVGINYRFGGKDLPERKKKSVAAPQAVQKQQHIPVPDATPAAAPVFNKRPKAALSAKPAPKQIKTNYKFKVRLKNATGSNATAERVAKFLQKHGYGVVSTQSIARRDKTEIRYLSQNSQSALQLAIKLPGNQDLRKMSKLDNDIDFEIIIGSDMVQSIR